ncbi:MAG: NAD(P)-dependent alcohol dehydrogenase [Sphingobium sp.]
MKVRAAIAAPGAHDFTIAEVDLDAPRADEILVRIAAVGLCHTDIVALEGGFGFEIPAVLGHEGAGVVEAVGSAVSGFAPGDRVALSFQSCGTCPKCDSGHPAYCHVMPLLNYAGMRQDGSRSIRRDGAELVSNFFGQSSFASHALTYARNLVKIDDDIPFEIAAPLGCGIQTGAGSVLNVFRPEPGSSILVTGGGTVGLSAVMAAKIAGCTTIIVAEPHAERRALALELGATHVIDPVASPDLAAAVRDIVPIGVDFAFDTSARETVLEAIMSALAPQGTLGCVGAATGEPKMTILMNQAVSLGLAVRGIIEGDSVPQDFIPRMIGYYRDGQMPLDRLITTYAFEDINRAVADQHDGKCIKVVLTLD